MIEAIPRKSWLEALRQLLSWLLENVQTIEMIFGTHAYDALYFKIPIIWGWGS